MDVDAGACGTETALDAHTDATDAIEAPPGNDRRFTTPAPYSQRKPPRAFTRTDPAVPRWHRRCLAVTT